MKYLKYLFILIFGLLALSGLGFALYMVLAPDLTQKDDPVVPVVQTPVPAPSPVPTPQPTGQSMRVATKDGGSLEVHDFRSAAESEHVILDSGEEYYLLTNGTNDAGYRIAYFVQAQTFNITVTKEPFADTEKIAEDVLARRLRVSAFDLCKVLAAVVTIKNGQESGESPELLSCKLI